MEVTQSDFNKTTIGSDYNKAPEKYPVDTLLEYLYGLMQQRDAGDCWNTRIEMEAVKELLKMQTNGNS